MSEDSPTESPLAHMPQVALVGRPNVGKSSLFNRLLGKAMALVDDTPGLTRDRKIAAANMLGFGIELVDTPGLEEAAAQTITGRMRAQTEQAVQQADLVLFVVDAEAGVTPLDEHYASWLRGFSKPMLLVANKCEGKRSAAGVLEALALGFGEPIEVSAAHSHGLGDLKQNIITNLQKRHTLAKFAAEEEVENWRDKPLHLAIVGRPNAGKSTLVNTLLGEDRMLVGPEAGLTRDAVHLPFEYAGRKIRLVDTAGLRKRAKINDKLEKMAAAEALRTIRLAHVVVVLMDAERALDKQDLDIARHVVDEGRALVLGINKFDLVPNKQAFMAELQRIIDQSLAQARTAPVVMLSALHGQNVEKLMAAVLQMEEEWNHRISTGKLNTWLAGAIDKSQPPMVNKRRVKVRYATQIKTRPPTFALWCNVTTNDMPESYIRYLTNSLRETFALKGIPLRIQLKKSDNPYKDEKAGFKD